MIPYLELKGEDGRLLLSLFGVTRTERGVQAELFCLHEMPRAREGIYLESRFLDKTASSGLVRKIKILTTLEQPRLGLVCFSPLEGEFVRVPKRRKTKKDKL